MKKQLLAILTIGMMVGCTSIEDSNKFVIAHRVDGTDTTTLRIIRVNKNFRIGDVVYPIIPKGDSIKFKIVRECIRVRG